MHFNLAGATLAPPPSPELRAAIHAGERALTAQGIKGFTWFAKFRKAIEDAERNVWAEEQEAEWVSQQDISDLIARDYP